MKPSVYMPAGLKTGMHLRYNSKFIMRKYGMPKVLQAKVILTGTVVPIREEYELSEYEIKGAYLFLPVLRR